MRCTWPYILMIILCGPDRAADVITHYEYDAASQVVRQSVVTAGQTLSDKRIHYDILGRADEADELATPGTPDADVDRISLTAWDVASNVTAEVRINGATRACTTCACIYTYDPAGRTTSRTDPRGQVTTYTNNWRGQSLTKTVDGTLKESFTYYPTGWMKAAWRDTPTEAAATNKSAFTCDTFGQVTSVTQTVDGIAKTIASQFLASGDRSQLTYPADLNLALTFTYDNLGQATRIDRNGQQLAAYLYAGRTLTQRDITTASTTATHVTYSVGLDAHRRQVRLKNSASTGASSTLLDQYDYTYDNAGNRQSAAVTGDARLDPNTTYGYDNLDRVISADYGTGHGTESFNYDLLGNRLSSPAGYTDRQGRTTAYTHNSVNEYQTITPSTQNPVHDGGNLTQTENGYRLEYDYENRLVTVRDKDASHTTLATYTYDALGHRVKQVKGTQTTRYYYDGETVLAEYDSTNTLQRYHIHGPTYVDEHLVLNQSGQEYYYLLTSLYSVSGLADASGKVVERYRYDAYGAATWFPPALTTRDFLRFQAAFSGDQPCSEAARVFDYTGDGKVNLADYRTCFAGGPGAAAALSPYRFTGQPLDFHLTDPTTGRPTLILHHYRARAYDAYNGRFCQKDPELYADSMDLYEYVGSDPTGEVDPTGRFTYLELLTTTLNYGMRAYNAYQTAKNVRGYVEEIIAGADLRTVLLEAVIDTAASYGGGKAFDKMTRTLSVLTARYAKDGVSQTMKKISRQAGEHLHHLLPKFLDGDPGGLFAFIPKEVHQKFHAGFLRLLSKENIKLSGQAGDTWKKLFEANPELKWKAWDLLLKYTWQFDKKLLIGLMDQIREELKKVITKNPE